MNAGFAGFGARALAALDAAWDDPVVTKQARPPEVLQPVYDYQDLGGWAAEWSIVLVTHNVGTVIEQWMTALDERTCPECDRHHREYYNKGEGPYPPLHDHCRCQRVYSHTDWYVRYTEEWRQDFRWQSAFEWVLTGWE